jgi:2'-5' RNA ligase
MRLHASIRPPAPVVHDLQSTLVPELAYPGQVTWIHPSHWRLQIAHFGSVVQQDALHLADVLADRMSEVKAPTLRLSGLVALPEDGDDSIWVELDGDVDLVAELAAGMPRSMLEFGFVLDRRAYRSRIQLGKITPATTADYLEGLIARHGPYKSDPWTADGVTLGHHEIGSAEREPHFEVLRMCHFASLPGRHAAGSDDPS